MSEFADIEAGEWWAPHAHRLLASGVTRGCSEPPLRFCGDQTVTRAQMASFLVRLFDLPSAGEQAGFADVPAGGEHAANIDALAASGVTRGCSESPLRFCPEQAATRAQMASFIDRALEEREQPGGRLFVDVAAGRANSCGLRGNGELLCWGIDNWDINEVPAGSYSDVSIGHAAACAVRRGGELVCWGTAVQNRPQWWTPPGGGRSHRWT